MEMRLRPAWNITGQTRKKNTVSGYQFVLGRFAQEFEARFIDSIDSEETFLFLALLTGGKKQSTRYSRCAHLRAFFNHILDRYQFTFANPCDSLIIKRVFRPPRMGIRTVLDRESVDEIIYTSMKMRDRLILELQARAGMRIGEVLKLTPNDIDAVRVRIRNPKSGREQETVFITRRISERLRNYIRDRNIGPGDRIFPMSYNGARLVVKRAGRSRGLNLTPHDLRRHAATFASRSGVPLEVVSKIILRHRNLSTTQRYLGKVSEAEAASWIDRIYE